MRIAFVSSMSAAPWGGSEVLWARTAAEAIKQGHTVFASVMTWPAMPSPIADLKRQGCVIHQRPHYSAKIATRLLRRVQHTLKANSLEQSLAAFAPDVICLSQGGNFDIATMPTLRHYLLSAGVPYCLVCHNYDAGKLPSTAVREAAVAAYAGARKVFFVSADQAHVSQRQLAHSFLNTELVKNPVNIAHPELLPWPPAEELQLAMVGGLHIDFKGQDILLEVLSHSTWKSRTWHLNIYGEGYDREYIETLISLYGLSNRVTLHGHVSNIRNVWMRNHVLLLPSRREAAPLVAMEAMLSGRVIVATSVGTIPEWVLYPGNGFVAPAPTVSAINQALEEAWGVRAEWPSIGRRAYDWAVQNVDLKADATFLQCIIDCTTEDYKK